MSPDRSLLDPRPARVTLPARDETRLTQGPAPALRELLARDGSFTVAAEVVTSRGVSGAGSDRAVRAHALELAADPRFDVLSITDNPGGNAMLAPDVLGSELAGAGQEVIIHLACKDLNRNELESRAWQLGSEGFDNILALSGDYPVTWHDGLAAPVFDIDSVALLQLLSDMNQGIRHLAPPGAASRADRFSPTCAFRCRFPRRSRR